MLDENKSALVQAEAKLISCQQEKDTEDARLQYLVEQYRAITDWAKEFDYADNDTRKMILARLIERIEVGRDYHLTIKFHVSMDDFIPEAQPARPIFQADETSAPMTAIAG